MARAAVAMADAARAVAGSAVGVAVAAEGVADAGVGVAGAGAVGVAGAAVGVAGAAGEPWVRRHAQTRALPGARRYTASMQIDVELPQGPFLFVSDAHLGIPVGTPGREQDLVSLLREEGRNARGVFVLGDLFDFWFEYRHAVPKFAFATLHALASLVHDGVPVFYLGGNHDFWAGSYLEREVGVRAFDRPILARLEGRVVQLAHGDGLGPGDTGYKILKKILRHPLSIALYRALHPDLGIPFAQAMSAESRKHSEPRDILLPKVVRDVARPRLGADITAMVMGHVHEPCHYRENKQDFLIIGDWIENRTFVVFDGEFSLRRFDHAGSNVIQAEAFPPAPLAPRRRRRSGGR